MTLLTFLWNVDKSVKPYKKFGQEAESDNGTDNEELLEGRKKKRKRKQSTDVGTKVQEGEPKRRKTKAQKQQQTVGKCYYF